MAGPSNVHAVTRDPSMDAVYGRTTPDGGTTNCHAVSAVQGATAGQGSAVSALSSNAAAPVIAGRGPGVLLELRDANGASVASVSQTGGLTVAGGVSGALGAVSATTVNASGAISGLSVAATNAVTGATVAATGALSGAALTVTTIGGTGDATITSGDLIANTAGKGLKIKEGSNARMGTLTLNGSTPVVVSTTAVTASSRIFLTHNAAGGVPAFAWVSARTAGTSFSVTGTAADTSTVAWLIVEPA